MKIRVSHILLQYDYEAQDVLRALQNGKSFEELAQKYSKCSSAKQGGDLGVFAEGRLDPDFEEVAFSLKVGQTTNKPVRTRFGFHIIRRTA
jgi:peptidylprolyl isomerase/peptidyl-prolyl cis-trans isomerase C